MTDKHTLAEHYINDFDGYLFGDICAFEVNPSENAIRVHIGFRPEDKRQINIRLRQRTDQIILRNQVLMDEFRRWINT